MLGPLCTSRKFLPQRTSVSVGDKTSPAPTQPPIRLGWEWGIKHAPGPRPPGSYLGKQKTGNRAEDQKKSLGGQAKARRSILASSALTCTLAGRTVASTAGRVAWHQSQDPYLRAQVKPPHSGKLYKVPSSLLGLA